MQKSRQEKEGQLQFLSKRIGLALICILLGLTIALLRSAIGSSQALLWSEIQITVIICLFGIAAMTLLSRWIGPELLLIWVSLFLMLIPLELSFRNRPQLMGYKYSLQLLSRYQLNYYGMYYTPEGQVVRLMKPNFETRCYQNGYDWNSS